MQQLKNQFDTFKEIAISKGFSELNLNKSAPKDSYSSFCGEKTLHESKGVKSDFVKIFKIKFNKENAHSIGFTFNYQDVPQETISVSLKTGLEYWQSRDYTVEEFREKIKPLLVTMKEGNYNDTMKLIKQDFELSLPIKNKRKLK